MRGSVAFRCLAGGIAGGSVGNDAGGEVDPPPGVTCSFVDQGAGAGAPGIAPAAGATATLLGVALSM